MPVRNRLLLLFLPLMLLSLAAVWLLSQQILLQRFDQLDAEQLADDANQLHLQLHQEMARLTMQGRDWAWWDDTYNFVEDHNRGYVEKNLDLTTLVNLRLHFLLIYDRQGRLIEQRWNLPAANQLITANGASLPAAQEQQRLVLEQIEQYGISRYRRDPRETVSAWLKVGGLPALASSTPTSRTGDGIEANGNMVMGYFLTRELIKEQQNQLLMQFQLADNQPVPAGSFPLDISSSHASSQAWLTPRQLVGDHQETRLVLLDDQGQPVISFALQRERPIYQQGRQSINLFVFSVLVIILLGAAGGFLGLEVWVIRRLQQMNRAVSAIGQHNDSERLHETGHDEFGQLAGEINQMLERIEQSERRDRVILDNIQDGFFELDVSGKVMSANRSLEQMLGYPPGGMRGQPIVDVLHSDDALRTRAQFIAALEAEGKAVISAQLKRRDGSFGHFEGRFSVIYGQGNQRIGYRGIVRDVSGQVALQNRLMDMAYRDPLTGLGNRKAFLEQLRLSIEEADTHQRSLALFYIDLDRFKEVNDRFGHDAGDELLTLIAERLRSSLRDPDRIYRLGGDEFTLLMPGGTRESAQRLADRLLSNMQQPMNVRQGLIDFVTPSIGIALYPEHANEATSLISAADHAMYQAKRQRNHACVYQPSALSSTTESR